MGIFEWARPGWAWTLLAPLVLWWLLRLRHRPPSVVTGTWRLWKEVARDAPQRAKVLKRGTPPWVWFCLAALLSGALALTGPRTRSEAAPRLYTIVVDPTLSMDLELEGDETRRESALARARRWIEAEVGDRDVVRWLPGVFAFDREGVEPGREPPPSVLSSPGRPRP